MRRLRACRATTALAVLVACCVLHGCDEDENPTDDLVPAPPDSVPVVTHPALRNVRSFAVVANGPDLDEIAASAYDLVVVDYARDRTEKGAFTPGEVASLRASGDGKVVLAHLRIGEADSLRFYWQLDGGAPGADWSDDPPSWLGPASGPGRFRVRFWEEGWRAILVSNPGGDPVIGNQLSYLDRLLARGYDGVFLDLGDVFTFFGPETGGGNGERMTAAADMAELVGAIAGHARLVRSGFIVCQVNGENLVRSDLSRPLTDDQVAALYAAIDHLSLEEVFYRGSRDVNNAFLPARDRILDADLFRARGKLVTVVDFFDPDEPDYESDDVDDFFERAEARGWIAYAGPRALDHLVVTPGHEPDERLADGE